MADEIVFGQDPVPSTDGSDYDEYSPQPSLHEVLDYLLEAEIENEFICVAVGNLDSPGKGVSHFAAVIRPENLENAAAAGGSTQLQWSRALGASVPFKHVSSIVIKEI